MWMDAASIETTYWEKGITALKASILTYPVYLLTTIISVFGERGGSINMGVFTDMGVFTGIAGSVQLVIMFILATM